MENFPQVIFRLVAAEKLREKIAEEAAIKKSETAKESNSKRNLGVDQMVKTENEKSSVHTRKELAKIAGVGTGTVARYDKIMQSSDEDTKQKVRTGQMTINAGYEKVSNKKPLVQFARMEQ